MDQASIEKHLEELVGGRRLLTNQRASVARVDTEILLSTTQAAQLIYSLYLGILDANKKTPYPALVKIVINHEQMRVEAEE